MDELDWYSQPTGMGAFTSEATEKLLGTPGVENLELLVRESAQNSWDAALNGTVPQFGIDYRVLLEEHKHTIGDIVFKEGREFTSLPGSLEKHELDVLEVWDRGTTGLNGPIRADLTVPEGTPTNFIDLVFMIGSSNKDADAGGNYGFGKSSAFKCSEAKAIIYWTVCFNQAGAREHRLIASGVSKEFDIAGRSHVGRHWWGNRVTDEATGETRLEPLVGVAAQELGESLFARKFLPGETGTSILIVDPDELALIGSLNGEDEVTSLNFGDDRERLVDTLNKRLTDVSLKHLWPKLLTKSNDRRMQIFVNGSEITEATAKNHPHIGSYMACLDAVRESHELGQKVDSNPNMKIVSIVVGRKREVVGHVALMTNIDLDNLSAGSAGLDIGTEIPKNSVALMRDGAELVVKYMNDIQDHPKDALYWVGVFKPCPEFDPDFAAAEPSSHDDWVVGSLQGLAKTRVKVSLQRIKEAVFDFLGTNVPLKTPAGSGSVSELALELGKLVATFGNDPGNQQGGTGDGSREPKPNGTPNGSGKGTSSKNADSRSLQVIDFTLEATTAQRNTHGVEVHLDGDWTKARDFAVRPKVRIEGSAKAATSDDHFEFHWPASIREKEKKPNGESFLTLLTPNKELIFEISSPGHLSFDLELEAN